MAAPFDLTDLSARADAMASRLRAAEEYRDDMWADDAIGPLLRVYAMLTHFPEEALAGSEETIAECRVYAYAWMARLHSKRDGCDCMEVDGMDDLLSELDAVAGPGVAAAIKSANADANRQFAKLKKAGNIKPLEG